MTSPKDILQTRLANGEISEEEYDRLLAKFASEEPASLGENAEKVDAPPPLPEADKQAGTKKRFPRWVIYTVIAVAAFGLFRTYTAFSGLSVTDLRIQGTRVEHSLVNQTAKSEDVVLEISVNDHPACYKILRVTRNSRRTVSYSCSAIVPGDMISIVATWAKLSKSLVAKAQRIN